MSNDSKSGYFRATPGCFIFIMIFFVIGVIATLKMIWNLV
jgi:hypothetical protein